MWIAGDGEKREDISFCFRHFILFRDDFQILLNKGIIKRVAFDHYEWTKNMTSLAKYFKWIGDEAANKDLLGSIPGGFWNPIAIVFKVNKRTLSNVARRKKSSHFNEIKKTVEEYRKKVEQQKVQEQQERQKQEQQEQMDRKTFAAIKILIDKANGEDIKDIKAVLEKIKTALV